MARYVLRRLLLLPLSLFLLSLVCFGLRQITPGDPVISLMPNDEARLSNDDPAAFDLAYRRAAQTLGLDRPTFYFSAYNGALPDTLHRITRAQERAMLRTFTLRSGNWSGVQQYYQELRRLAYGVGSDADVTPVIRRLLIQDNFENAATTLQGLSDRPETAVLRESFDRLQSRDHASSLLLPAFSWHGTDNQYHQWAGKLLSGDFGSSLVDRRPVTAKIKAAAGVTILLNGLALLLVYLISIPLGLYTAGARGSWFDRLTTVGLFILFGVPSFWLATLLTNYFTTPAFNMDFFPSMGLGELPEGASWWTILRIRASHLFLPVVCMAYPSWAYVTRHLRRSALHELNQAYIKTARLKGLSRSTILWRHVLRNASFPIITLLGGIFPALLAGSVLIERIFNLPGMGQLLYTSAIERDWPVVITLVLLNGILTAIGLLIADLGYRLADPRIRLSSPQNAAS